MFTPVPCCAVVTTNVCVAGCRLPARSCRYLGVSVHPVRCWRCWHRSLRISPLETALSTGRHCVLTCCMLRPNVNDVIADRPAPSKTVPRANVIIRLCSIECNFAAPFSDPSNAPFQKDMDSWAKISNRTYIWNYVTNFGCVFMQFLSCWLVGCFDC